MIPHESWHPRVRPNDCIIIYKVVCWLPRSNLAHGCKCQRSVSVSNAFNTFMGCYALPELASGESQGYRASHLHSYSVCVLMFTWMLSCYWASCNLRNAIPLVTRKGGWLDCSSVRRLLISVGSSRCYISLSLVHALRHAWISWLVASFFLSLLAEVRQVTRIVLHRFFSYLTPSLHCRPRNLCSTSMSA